MRASLHRYLQLFGTETNAMPFLSSESKCLEHYPLEPQTQLVGQKHALSAALHVRLNGYGPDWTVSHHLMLH